MELDRKLVQILFDCAINSMDFGSGMMDDEEVSALREVAVMLGVDPDEATPCNFKCKYRGAHRTRHRDPSNDNYRTFNLNSRSYTSCQDCGRIWYDDQGGVPDDVKTFQA